MVKLGNEFIQAFPIQDGTYISPDGGMTGFDVKARRILHVAADGNLTFHFKDNTQVVVPVSAGQDLAIGHQCETIDADCKVWIT